MSDMPTDLEICTRLRELSDAVTKGEKGMGEFTMRIPPDRKRDADLVLDDAARRIESAAEEKRELQRDADRYRFLRDEENWGKDNDLWSILGEMTGVDFDAAVEARMKRSKNEGLEG